MNQYNLKMKLHLKHRAKNLSYLTLSKFINFDPSTAISLFCDPRGGSTWLAETLNTIQSSVIMDEPLHLRNMKSLQKMNFTWSQYIPEEVHWPEAKEFFELLLKGKKLNTGTCYYNTPIEIMKAKQLILKIIRGKALLPWYVKQFNFKYKPIFVVRHPFALAASQINHPAWNYEFKPFQIPSSPFNEFYKPHKLFLTSLKTKEERLTAFWCMTNSIVLNHPQNDRSWISLNYENLVLNPEHYFQKIFGVWDLKIPQSLYAKIQKPSSTTIGKTHIEPNKLLTDWQKKLSATQVDRLQNVLDYFGVNFYNREVLPIVPANKIHIK